MLYEPASPGTKESNGHIERTGGVLTQRARAMRIHANLPKDLSHEMYRTAAYILNRTPPKHWVGRRRTRLYGDESHSLLI
jgi:hypothetical protein